MTLEDQDYPPEHPMHHETSMVLFAGALGLGLLLVYIADQIELSKNMIFVVAAVGFSIFLFMLCRTTSAKCPNCKVELKNKKSITIKKSNWTVLSCLKCEKQWRIPALSSE